MLRIGLAFGMLAMPVIGTAAVIDVPSDYTTIQEAINNAVSGDTVFVNPGTYIENVVVDRSILLVGADSSSAIIDAGNAGHAIDIVAGGVTITGFTLTNASNQDAAVHAIDVDGIGIKGNIISGNGSFGIHTTHSDWSRIRGNRISDNGNSGIILYRSTSSVIDSNVLFNTNIGVQLERCSGDSVVGNTFSDTYIGVHSYDCSLDPAPVVVHGNTMEGCTRGVSLRRTVGALIQENLIQSNEYGIYVYYGNWCSIEHNEVVDNVLGIHMSGSYHTVFGNVFANTDNALDQNANIWDDGYPDGGNSWSDYLGDDTLSGENQDQPGADGVGDAPYPIPGGTEVFDNYPLMSGQLVADANGPYYGVVGEPVQFDGITVGGTAPYGYYWDFGDDQTSEEEEPEHIYSHASDFTVVFSVIDTDSMTVVDNTTTYIRLTNATPYIPEIFLGPDSVPFYASYKYGVYATDPDDDPVYYQMDWGDGQVSDWRGPYPETDSCYFYHAWEDLGTYEVSTRAKDDWGETSEWTEALTVYIIWVLCGDANMSGFTDIDDVVYTVAYIFSGGPPPVPWGCTGDSDGSHSVEIDDVVYTINYIFSYGPDPVEDCCDDWNQ
jgi:parallel beta-helix repeat protein